MDKKSPLSNQQKKLISESFVDFCETVARLRDPKDGCPWDLQQTHESLRRYMIEEAYEATAVMHPVDYEELRGELGDVLLQVVLNAQIAADHHAFSIESVIKSINEKMIRRHPHVFDNDGNQSSSTDDSPEKKKHQIRQQWEDIKALESQQRAREKKHPNPGFFSHLTAHETTPALRRTVAIGKRAAEINFDWQSAGEVIEQLRSELSELSSAIATASKDQVYSELSDVMFTVGQLCRKLDCDPEITSHDGNEKFLARFRQVELLAQTNAVDINTAAKDILEMLWRRAKDDESENKRGVVTTNDSSSTSPKR